MHLGLDAGEVIVLHRSLGQRLHWGHAREDQGFRTLTNRIRADKDVYEVGTCLCYVVIPTAHRFDSVQIPTNVPNVGSRHWKNLSESIGEPKTNPELLFHRTCVAKRGDHIRG